MKKVELIIGLACLAKLGATSYAQEANPKFKLNSIQVLGNLGIESSNNASYNTLLSRAHLNPDKLGDISKYSIDYNGSLQASNYLGLSLLLGFTPLQKKTNTYFERREVLAGLTIGKKYTHMQFPGVHNDISNFYSPYNQLSDTSINSHLSYSETSKNIGIESFLLFHSKQIKLCSIYTGLGGALTGFFDNNLVRGISKDTTFTIEAGGRDYTYHSHEYSEQTYSSANSVKTSAIIPVGASIQLGKKSPMSFTIQSRLRIAYQYYFSGRGTNEFTTALESTIGLKYKLGNI